MIPLLAFYLDRLEELHADVQRAIDELPPEALDWSPGPGMNSIAVLVAHVAGSMRYWIGEVAGGAASGRDRPAEFRTKDVGAAELKARLEAALAHSREVLAGLTLADLEASRLAPIQAREFSAGWALAHALEHTAIHVGHIQITVQLWGQRR